MGFWPRKLWTSNNIVIFMGNPMIACGICGFGGTANQCSLWTNPWSVCQARFYASIGTLTTLTGQSNFFCRHVDKEYIYIWMWYSIDIQCKSTRLPIAHSYGSFKSVCIMIYTYTYRV
jgi:hypothetical protein